MGFLTYALALSAFAFSTHVSAEEFCDVGPQFRSDSLVNSVCTYYQYESSAFWDKTYKIRTSAFRDLVPIATYVKQMTNDSREWKLLRIQIVNVRHLGSKADVDIVFYERRISENGQVPKGTLVKFRGNSIWTMKGADWFCYDCVTRAHFALNAPLAGE